jgi:hypothetical protein
MVPRMCVELAVGSVEGFGTNVLWLWTDDLKIKSDNFIKF